jgi:hypothetical protein
MADMSSKLLRRVSGIRSSGALSGTVSAMVPWLLLLLAGCGGSLYLSTGTGDEPPAVSLALGANSAAQGATVRLAAAAVDDNGVALVAFFRVEADGRQTPLGIDTAAPYEVDTVVPTDASGSVRFFARATDTANQAADSAVVSLAVR